MVEASEQIVTDLPCVNCGYNLRMQPTEGLCPECGGRIWKSLDESVLNWGAEYLNKLASSAKWVAVTALALPLSLIIGIILIRILAQYVLPAPGPDPMKTRTYLQILDLCLPLPFAVAVIIHTKAVWRFAASPPGRRYNHHQILMRVGVIMFLAAAAEPLFQYLIIRLFSYSDEQWHVIYYAQYIQCALPFLLVGLALYPQQAAELLDEIYRRAGQKAHAAWACWSLWLFSGGVLLLDGALVVLMMFGTLRRHSSNRWETICTLLALAGAGAMLLGLIGTVAALLKFSGRMRALARAAAVPALFVKVWPDDHIVWNPPQHL